MFLLFQHVFKFYLNLVPSLFFVNLNRWWFELELMDAVC